jgi:hypothetical protein
LVIARRLRFLNFSSGLRITRSNGVVTDGGGDGQNKLVAVLAQRQRDLGALCSLHEGPFIAASASSTLPQDARYSCASAALTVSIVSYPATVSIGAPGRRWGDASARCIGITGYAVIASRYLDSGLPVNQRRGLGASGAFIRSGRDRAGFKGHPDLIPAVNLLMQ